MRWVQKVNDDGTSRFEPGDTAARHAGGGQVIHGDIVSFVSPVDGTVISDRGKLREHNKRHDVVNADEFSPEFFQRKAKERADFYQGNHSKKEILARKQEIYEVMIRAERNGR